ncbi:hypothetical protein [Nostoc sp. T09]|uniref:hypothetical protein n=1 Tax=Nostoc sp. T09 TaxID=1932621 RepID=UPI00117CC642|nr:hypothetical protein [Nostoc sp. T09]
MSPALQREVPYGGSPHCGNFGEGFQRHLLPLGNASSEQVGEPFWQSDLAGNPQDRTADAPTSLPLR